MSWDGGRRSDQKGSTGMAVVLARPAISFGSEQHDIADLVLAGVLTGSWQQLVDVAVLGVALQATLHDRPTADELRTILAEFRYERRLLAAAELVTWLNERSLDRSELDEVMQRRWLRAGFADRVVSAPDPAAVSRVLWAEAICEGELIRLAAELRGWHSACTALEEAAAASDRDRQDVESLVAVAEDESLAGLGELGPDELTRRATRLVGLRAQYRRFCASAVSEELVAARLVERRLEWTVVTGSELAFAIEGAAREARMSVVHDGLTLEAVAELLGVAIAQRRVELGDAPDGMRAELLGARSGDLVGPWLEGEHWRLLALEQQRDPSADQGPLRERARNELIGELVERAAAGIAGSVGAL